jgi:hypothetical protein
MTNKYKETILNMFHSLTEIEIDATLDVMKADPEKNNIMGQPYIMAVNRCREILEIILKDK